MTVNEKEKSKVYSNLSYKPNGKMEKSTMKKFINQEKASFK